MSHFMEIKPLDSQLRARQSLPSVEIPLEIVDFDMNNPIILDPKGNYRGFSVRTSHIVWKSAFLKNPHFMSYYCNLQADLYKVDFLMFYSYSTSYFDL